MSCFSDIVISNDLAAVGKAIRILTELETKLQTLQRWDGFQDRVTVSSHLVDRALDRVLDQFEENEW